jgi:hypothetical protein
MIPANALDSVAGTLVRGLISTSKVALEGSSAANRTLIGAETEATAVVSPLGKKCLKANLFTNYL